MQVFGLKSTFLESRKVTIQKRELIIEEVHSQQLFQNIFKKKRAIFAMTLFQTSQFLNYSSQNNSSNVVSKALHIAMHKFIIGL